VQLTKPAGLSTVKLDMYKQLSTIQLVDITVTISSRLHHGRRTPQTSVGEAPRVLVRDAACKRHVIRWRFDHDQLDWRADCRRVAGFTSAAMYDSSRRARLSTSSHRPHRDDDKSSVTVDANSSMLRPSACTRPSAHYKGLIYRLHHV